MTRLLLHRATLIDGTGAAPVPSAAVLVEDGKITWAGVEEDLPPQDGAAPVRVDLAGNTICPGFFDCHVHFGLPARVDCRSTISCVLCPTITFNSSSVCV